ncbi:hypothetical protein FE257_004291 [Aspergillus nanangensis]|uniref:KN homeodomain domain-containing protein n=1 Tax=Aspergillus nanangensis TaxID=2582783 RepID=A0AAD4CRN2_ASPNN|nr:hypothetical protein FE257_004291 [Aspergillus nanangensis]
MAYISAERTQNHLRCDFECIVASLPVKSTVRCNTFGNDLVSPAASHIAVWSSSIRTAGKHRRTRFSNPAVDILQNWLRDHVDHPYPTEDEKQALMRSTGLNYHQIILLVPWPPAHINMTPHLTITGNKAQHLIYQLKALSPWDADPSHTKAETRAPG